MDDQDALLRAIVQNPQDDWPRLVYADWLEEHGQAERAELIRVQIQRANLPHDDPQQPPLRTRERHLLDEYSNRWLAPVQALLRQVTFCRGFPEFARVETHLFLREHAALFRFLPTLRGLHLYNAAAHLHGLILSPGLAPVRELSIAAQYLHDAVFQQFALAESLQQLEALDLSSNNLTRMSLSVLVRRWGSSLQSLNVQQNLLEPDVFVNGLAELRSLRLRRLAISLTESTLDSMANRRQAPWSLLQSLETFTVRLLRANSTMLRHLAESPILPWITHLEISHMADTAELGTLLQAAPLERLEALSLAFSLIGNRGLRDLLQAEANLPRLHTLNLSRTGISHEGIRLLCESPLFQSLAHLDLSYAAFDPNSLNPLLGSFPQPRLVTLDLIYCRLTEGTKRKIAQRFGPDVCLFDR